MGIARVPHLGAFTMFLLATSTKDLEVVMPEIRSSSHGVMWFEYPESISPSDMLENVVVSCDAWLAQCKQCELEFGDLIIMCALVWLVCGISLVACCVHGGSRFRLGSCFVCLRLR